MIGAPAESAPHFTSDLRLKFALLLELEDKRIFVLHYFCARPRQPWTVSGTTAARKGPDITYALICLYKVFVKTFYVIEPEPGVNDAFAYAVAQGAPVRIRDRGP